jgi:hypothetical protein
MKKVILILVVAFSTLSLLSIEKNHIIQKDSIENVECKHRQCNATAKSTGKRCKHCVSESSDYQCYQHKPK